MTVKELIAELLKLPPDIPIILQKDSEGNGYSPLAASDDAFYVAESTWSGQVYGEDEKPDNAVRCCVLFPVN